MFETPCDHEWGEKMPRFHESHHGSGQNDHDDSVRTGGDSGCFCTKCGAWKGGLGMEPNLDLYVSNLVEIFRELRRCLRPDGVFWLNLGDTYSNRAIIRPSSHQGGLGHENDSISTSWKEHSSGGTVRMGEPGLKEKDLMAIPWRVALACQADGWWLRSGIPWVKKSAMPENVHDRPTVSHEYIFLFSKSKRYYYGGEEIKVPLAHPNAQGHPFGGTKYPGQQGASTYSGRAYDASHLTGRNRRTGDWFYDSLEILIEQTRTYLAHLEQINEEGGLLEAPDGHPLGMLLNPQPFSEAHFAVFPSRLVEPLIKAGTPSRICAKCRAPWIWKVESESVPTRETTDTKFGTSEDDIRGTAARERRIRVTRSRELIPNCECADDSINAVVIDPFLGSGTVGVVAHKLGRDWLGCDISLEYCELGKKRMEKSGETSVFAFLDL
jgi:DNA modification methylase